MKNLKLYENLLTDEVEKTVNNDLISDIKEMSLEYLDMEMKLSIDVFAQSMYDEWLRVSYYEYSHTEDLHDWYNTNPDIFEYPVKIGYEIMLSKRIALGGDKDYVITSWGDNKCRVACVELYNRIKVAYPNDTFLPM